MYCNLNVSSHLCLISVAWWDRVKRMWLILKQMACAWPERSDSSVPQALLLIQGSPVVLRTSHGNKRLILRVTSSSFYACRHTSSVWCWPDSCQPSVNQQMTSKDLAYTSSGIWGPFVAHSFSQAQPQFLPKKNIAAHVNVITTAHICMTLWSRVDVFP